jgi:hypothetical protein
MVARHGQIAWFKAQGAMGPRGWQADAFRYPVPYLLHEQTITSVVVMMLYEEGAFLLDDPVSKYLPEFKNPKVLVKPASGEPYSIPAAQEITILDLLRHPRGSLIYLSMECRAGPDV